MKCAGVAIMQRTPVEVAYSGMSGLSVVTHLANMQTSTIHLSRHPMFHSIANSSMTPLPRNRRRVSGIGLPEFAGLVTAGIDKVGVPSPT